MSHKFAVMGCGKIGAPEAACSENVSITYVWMHWKLRIVPAPTSAMPMSGAIQCTSARAVQPVMNSPAGSRNDPGTIDAVKARRQLRRTRRGG